METVALDLDRVLFDTNGYIAEVRRRMEAAGLNPEEMFRRASVGKRKDLSTLYSIVSRLADADSIFVEPMDGFVRKEVKEVVETLAKRFNLVVISVGDGLQHRKIATLPVGKLVLVEKDEEKVRMAELIRPAVFVDDKKSVVEEMRSRGLRAYQAVWFLDEKHRKGCLEDALHSPEDLLVVLDGLDR